MRTLGWDARSAREAAAGSHIPMRPAGFQADQSDRDPDMTGETTMVMTTHQPTLGVIRLPWVAFACALVVIVLTYSLMEHASAAALFLLPVPGLLLIAGGFLRGADVGYARACLALGIYQDVILSLHVLSAYAGPLEIPPPFNRMFITGGDWLLAIPTAMGAGIAPAALAARGRVSRAMGIAGGVVSVAALALGAILVNALARLVL